MEDEDIVHRLREMARRSPVGIFEQAACEIEKLRADLRMAEKWRDNYRLAYDRQAGIKVRNGSV